MHRLSLTSEITWHSYAQHNKVKRHFEALIRPESAQMDNNIDSDILKQAQQHSFAWKCYPERRFPKAGCRRTTRHSQRCRRSRKYSRETSTWLADEPAGDSRDYKSSMDNVVVFSLENMHCHLFTVFHSGTNTVKLFSTVISSYQSVDWIETSDRIGLLRLM